MNVKSATISQVITYACTLIAWTWIASDYVNKHENKIDKVIETQNDLLTEVKGLKDSIRIIMPMVRKTEKVGAINTKMIIEINSKIDALDISEYLNKLLLTRKDSIEKKKNIYIASLTIL